MSWHFLKAYNFFLQVFLFIFTWLETDEILFLWARIPPPEESNFSENSPFKIREKIHKQGLGEFVIGIFVSRIMYFRGWHRFELNLHPI